MKIESWEERYDELFTKTFRLMSVVYGHTAMDVKQSVKDFINTEIPRAVKEERKRVLEIVEETYKDFKSKNTSKEVLEK